VKLDSSAPKEMELTQLGRYRLCYELASGGMATVYLARMDGAHGFEKLVALKRIHPHLVSDRSYVDMFLDEARIASGITHPNVCSVFDFGEFEGEYFLAMEYLVGEPLARLCRRAAASNEQRNSPTLPLRMARIIEEACEGLHAAHESKDQNGRPLNVVHRDVTPRNLFMTYSGVVQVVDFGIASARQRVHRTSTGQLKGTVPYMAPEQIRGGEADRRVDIWGLGVVLWEMLTLRRLFRRDTEVESMYAVMVDEIPAPSTKCPGVPAELDAIVMKALERDPEKRWSTAREMGQALHAFAASQKEVVGAAELSNWMGELFPAGETRKREIMELALTEGFQLHPGSAQIGAEVSGARTVAGDLESALAAKALETKIAEEKPTEAPSKPKWLWPAVAAAVLALPIIGIFGYQASKPEARPLPTPEVADVAPVVPVAEPTTPTAGPSDEEVAGVEAPATDSNPVAVGAAEPATEASPTDEPNPELPKVAEPKPAARKKVARKARARRKQSRPDQTEPKATGLPGHVKITTKGHSVEIYERGKLLGRAPTKLTLPAGRHSLRLKSTESGETLTLPVNVVANATKTISLDLD
jgi:serine/threonine-protein kinase